MEVMRLVRRDWSSLVGEAVDVAVGFAGDKGGW